MNLQDFIDFHKPVLNQNSAKHNLILSILSRVTPEQKDFMFWSFDKPGACAIWAAKRNLLLADLAKEHCKQLVEQTKQYDYPGILGPAEQINWFKDYSSQVGMSFTLKESMQVLHIVESPEFPDTEGYSRKATPDDIDLFEAWVDAFTKEAVPDDPAAPREELIKRLELGTNLFWIDQGRPVSMAIIIRDFDKTSAISWVYTPPEFRGKGYAGSVVASLAEQKLATGKDVICLYVDATNPASNKCYQKIGFEPVCDVQL